MIDKNKVTLFLLGGNQPILATVNDVIGGAYRVEKIDKVSAVLTYLPTNTQQTVVFNSNAVGASALSERPAAPIADHASADRIRVPAQIVGTDHPNILNQLKDR